MSDENIQVSIVVPCRREATAIRAFLESILENDYPQDQLEVLIVDGMSDDGTREVVEAFARQHPFIRLLDNPEQITPCALNIGIRQAKGRIIMRMDAHYEYPPDYISTLVDWLSRSGVDNVGGMVVMRPANDGPLARAIAAAVAHPFGIGNAYYRIGASQPRRVDTVPFGCYRREVFDRVGLFDEELVRNQDIELNLRLIREGGSILLVPGVVIAGQARQSFSKLVRTYYQYAYFNALVVKKLGRMMSLRHGIPGLFAAFLLLGGALAPLLPPARWALLAVVAAYGLCDLLFSLGVARRRGIACGLAVAAVFLAIHISYGLGTLKGVLDFLVLRRRVARKRGASIALTR